MQHNSILPKVNVQYTYDNAVVSKKPKAPTGFKLGTLPRPIKYDHAAVFAARLRGVSWQDIALQFGFPSAYRARKSMYNSRYLLNRGPDEIKLFEQMEEEHVNS